MSAESYERPVVAAVTSDTRARADLARQLPGDSVLLFFPDQETAARALAEGVAPFASEALRKVAHVLLPAGTFAETSGTYVNLEGVWQSQTGAAAPVGESRPGWKILRVLGNLHALTGFDYQSSEDVREELAKLVGAPTAYSAPAYSGGHAVGQQSGTQSAQTVVDIPMYQIDAVVRRAPSLQRTPEGRAAAVTY